MSSLRGSILGTNVASNSPIASNPATTPLASPTPPSDSHVEPSLPLFPPPSSPPTVTPPPIPDDSSFDLDSVRDPRPLVEENDQSPAEPTLEPNPETDEVTASDESETPALQSTPEPEIKSEPDFQSDPQLDAQSQTQSPAAATEPAVEKSPLEVLEEILATADAEKAQKDAKVAEEEAKKARIQAEFAAKEQAFAVEAQQRIEEQKSLLTEASDLRQQVEADLRQLGKIVDLDTSNSPHAIRQLVHERTGDE